eukprot:gene8433-9920_t
MGHRGRLGGSLFLTVLLLGCLAVSYSLAWYRVEYKPNSVIQNTSTVYTYYWWTKTKTIVKDEDTERDYDKDSDKNVKQIFTVSLAFLTASAAAAVVTAIFQIIGIINKSRVIRILSGILALASFALLAVSFFTFFGITKAFDKDNYCTLLLTDDDEKNYCEAFMGTFDNVLGDFKYGPYIGWWVGVGGLAFSLLSGITSFLA